MSTSQQPGLEVETSYSLLHRARSHDEDAWRCLCQFYGPLIYHWCRKAGVGAEDSADLLQEVFRCLVVHLAGFQKTLATGSFRAWLWVITRNRIRDHYRVQRGKVQAVGGSDAHWRLSRIPDLEYDDGADSSVSLSGGLMCRALAIVRNEVSENTWIAFWRSSVDGIAPAAVAVELGITSESVRQAKSRVFKRLRLLLQD
ncbi:MAG: sigma-70 family RNA polymerase sigma factor [Planctomycetota bacterium]|nr:sigma-70 family RNA polymerase sigma factor [Planctomycetota bacterium]